MSDHPIPREQWDCERMPDGTFRVRCSVCAKSVSSALPEPALVRAWIECPECIMESAAFAALAELARFDCTVSSGYDSRCVFCGVEANDRHEASCPWYVARELTKNYAPDKTLILHGRPT